MKWRKIIFITLVFLALGILGVNYTVEAILNKNIFQMKDLIFAQQNSPEATVKCSDSNPILNLGETNNRYLSKLNEYQIVCGSLVTNQLMIFNDMPKDAVGAQKRASEIASTLKLFKKYSIEPIVIIEPNTDWGLIDFEEFKNGFYDKWIDMFFLDLKQSGITDADMGTWVPFPEANLPYWNRSNSTPEDFAVNVSKFLGILKKYFPGAKGSILLSSATYSSDDFSWSNGEYLSLVPYVKDIKPGLVDSFGLQGFPWEPTAKSNSKPVLDPAEYLSPNLAIEAATALNVKSVWYNTGTFSAKYVDNPDNVIFVNPNIRKEILTKVLVQAKKIKDAGYTVSINLFSENKSYTAEATNWAYWDDYLDQANLNRNVFVDFVIQANADGIGISLYDSSVSSEVNSTTNMH